MFDNRGTKKSKEVKEYEQHGVSPLKKTAPAAAKVDTATKPVKLIGKK